MATKRTLEVDLTGAVPGISVAIELSLRRSTVNEGGAYLQKTSAMGA